MFILIKIFNLKKTKMKSVKLLCLKDGLQGLTKGNKYYGWSRGEKYMVMNDESKTVCYYTHNFAETDFDKIEVLGTKDGTTQIWCIYENTLISEALLTLIENGYEIQMRKKNIVTTNNN